MRVLLQRVKTAKVQVDDQTIGSIDRGLLAFLGVFKDDTQASIPYLVDKMIHLRIFSDDLGKMNRSLIDVQGDVLVVSQFTLYADVSQGRRPSFIQSAKPEKAKNLYDEFLNELKKQLKSLNVQIATGSFGANMQISLVNDGPVTILLER